MTPSDAAGLRPFDAVLIANRGEVALRIARAVAELGLRAVSVYSEDDDASMHRFAAAEALPLRGSGPAAYLDGAQLIALAQSAGCQAIHPGYGFLSENAGFARGCAEAGLVFIGPAPGQLALFGDKSSARVFAQRHGVPVPRGTDGPTTLDAMTDFMAGLGPAAAVMVKAVAGGGGRGMRRVGAVGDLAEAFARCRSEARLAFGNDALYVEELIPDARHIEVQVIGDGVAVSCLGERDCSIQRRHQKVVEVAPSPSLSPALRQALADAALRMASAAGYRGLGTFEFLVSGEDRHVFIEANPRLQVEHTITEEVMGIDLVRAQIQVAAGRTLAELGLEQGRIPSPRGFAIQLRVTMETAPEGGDRLEAFDIPSGPGIRVDTFGYAGFSPSRNFDSLLAKVICHSASAAFGDAVQRARRALREFRIAGMPTNLHLLQNLLDSQPFAQWAVTTDLLERHWAEFSAPVRGLGDLLPNHGAAPVQRARAPVAEDPGLVLAPMRCRLIDLSVAPGAVVRRGQQVAVVEAMKMEMALVAPSSGTVSALLAEAGRMLEPQEPILRLDPSDEEATDEASLPTDDDATLRADLAEVLELHRRLQDEARPEAVARRRRTGLRTARENLADLCDPGTFTEYAPLAVAARHSRHELDHLRDISPADGFICGLAGVNGALFGPERSRCIVASYDYTVFAGTQGYIGHKKHDRIFKLAEKSRLPVVLFAEGGGGRPPDDDYIGAPNLANPTFWNYGRLNGLVPLVGIAAGRCFAGNAALLGCCDVVIATEGASIGMGGPVMIEGAGLGVVRPEDVGPAPMHAERGVVDLLVPDEAAAVAAAKKYLSYFQGPVAEWRCADQALLRQVIPQRRTRAYDVRRVIAILADQDSILELRPRFGAGAVTALVRIEGRPIGIFANNPMVQAGAIGAEEADKISRFARLCDAFGITLLSLCDTPGIMVGPEAETTALVRRAARIFVAGAGLSVPLFTVVLRKAYGLGAMAMAGGSFHESPFFTIAWPTAEFGGMGIEGQVKLGYRKELAAIADEATREARYQELVQAVYERGKATRMAPHLSIDDVVDPAETRRWIIQGLLSQLPLVAPRKHEGRRWIDTW